MELHNPFLYKNAIFFALALPLEKSFSMQSFLLWLASIIWLLLTTKIMVTYKI